MTGVVRRTGRGLVLTATAVALAVVGAACSGGNALATSSTNATTAPIPVTNVVRQFRSGTTVAVSSLSNGPKVPNGFVGLSMEYHSLPAYVGTNPAKPNPVFLNLLQGLNPAGTPMLRVGGDSTDWTWWPVPGVRKPGGVRFDLTPHFAKTLKSIASDDHAKLLLGVNFEADSARVAAYEENKLAKYVGRSRIEAFLLGNEPELYHTFAWYKTPAGKKVFGRPSDYTVQSFISDFGNVARGLPSDPLAGPESTSTKWLNLPAFLASQPHLSLVTVHTYPLKHCSADAHPTNAQLFLPNSLSELAGAVGTWVKDAAARRLPLRVDEMNSVTCGGYSPVTSSFGPALWALNILPMYAAAGAVGVNFHTVPFDEQSLINPVNDKPVSRHNAQLRVMPEYYALLAFAKLAPPGSQLLRTAAPVRSGLLEWADRTPAGDENVVLTNPSSTAGRVNIYVPSQTEPATITMLRAAGGLGAIGGVTLGGQAVSASTGELAGDSNSVTVAPTTKGGHTYRVSMPAASAAILTFPAPEFQHLGG